MPTPEDPHYEPWSERLGKLLAARIDQPVVVVGHSLGGSVALKHLSEAGRREPIAGLLLVAAPFWGEKDWEAEWALPEGWPGAPAALPPTILFHSRDDEEIPFAQPRALREATPGRRGSPARRQRASLDRGDLTEIVETIRKLSAS